MFNLPDGVDPPPSEVHPQGTRGDSSHDERKSKVEEVAKLLLNSSKKHTYADEVKVKASPIAPYFREWKQGAFEDVRAARGRPCVAVEWIRAVGRAGVKFNDMADSRDFDALDAKLATALTKAPKHDDLKRRATKSQEAAPLKDEMVKGMGMLLMIMDWCKFVEAD